MTETEPDTETMVARLVHLLEESPGRAQDALVDGITALERAYSLESNSRVKDSIEEALSLLRSGSDHDSE